MKTSAVFRFPFSIIRSLWFDGWINVAVVLGVLCATAVLTGALLVGDSMRGSLKALTLNRLGNVDTILMAPSFISVPPDISVRKNLCAFGGGHPIGMKSEPVIYLYGSVEYSGKVCGVQILGLPPHYPLSTNHYPLTNQALADRLNIKPGADISLRLNSPQSIPPESSLGRRDQLIRTQITVNEIIPNHGIGRFSLKADQQAEPLIIVPLNWLQQKLGVGEKVNAVFFLTDSPQHVSTIWERRLLEKQFKPTPGDLGINVKKTGGEFYYVTSARLLFTQQQAKNINDAAKPGLLYLATSIKAAKNNGETPYSTVFAIDDILQENEIALNQWTADDLNVQTGDEIELTWFAPDNVNDIKSHKFILARVIPDGEYTNDVVPEVKGFTDEHSIADWNPPFPFDAKKIRKKDEDYWDKYGAAPKAFVSLATGQKLFGSRFGNVSTFIVPDDVDINTISNGTADDYAIFGLNFIPVKEQGLAASSGTTPFSVLFLSFSFFIIVSALLLVTMLFHLSVEMKTAQIGIRLAVGWTPFQVGKVLLSEGCVLATCGAVLGTFFGIGYAWLMIYGLTTWWLDAVTVPFLTLHINTWSLVIGCVSGLVLSAVTIALALRSIVRIPVNRLLKRTSDTGLPEKLFRQPMFFGLLRLTTFCLIPLCIFGFEFICLYNPYIELPHFFAVGFVLLVLGLIQVMPIPDKQFFVRSLYRFAYSNIIRHRRRSLYCIALIASTTFLVLSIGAFRIEVQQVPKAGISYIAETAFPVYEDISTPEGREKLSIQPDDEKTLTSQRFDILPFRMKGGDTSSCLNLYQTGNPRVLGASRQLETLKLYNADWSKLWQPVTTDSDGVRRVPVVLDSTTAMYALHLYGGIGEVYELDDGNGGKIRCEIAGLIDNSVLQGEIIMSAENLLQLFPEVGGYQYFLFCGSRDVSEESYRVMYDLLGDYGFQGETAEDRLRKLFAVQNTYISTFQSLGGIGLLLGVFGLAVIQSRNVFERRKEIALLQAIGFSKSRIILALLYESLILLFRGLFVASFASFFAVLPFFLGAATQTVRPEMVALQFIGLVGGMFTIGIISNAAAAMTVLKIPIGRELAAER
ncbi:ABC transporter permease [Planctomycetales bacterium]|nr:ABC transporter permease [Planctomycetales bacterium]